MRSPVGNASPPTTGELNNPRFSAENIARNIALLQPLEDIAKTRGKTTAQVALAWVLSRGEQVIPIPGMKRRTHLDENAVAVGLELNLEELAQLTPHFPPVQRLARSTHRGRTLGRTIISSLPRSEPH